MIATAGTGWAVVETRTNAELLAERSLELLGYRPLLIRYRKRIRGVRFSSDGRRVRSRSDIFVARPFLPRYLFLPLAYDDDATLVDADDGRGRPPGIKQIFRRPGDRRPCIIRSTLVEQLKIGATLKDEMPMTRQDLVDRLKAGEHLTFRHPLGFLATMVSLDDHDRGAYFTELFRRQVYGTITGIDRLEFLDL